MAAARIPATDFSDEQAQWPQPKSTPDWREICSGATCRAGSVDTSAASSTASPTSDCSKRSSPSEDDSPIVSSPINSSTASTAPFSYESESEEGSGADERTIQDSSVGDGEMTGTEMNKKSSKAEVLEGPRLAKALTQILENLTTQGARQGGAAERRTSFHASRRPNLSIGLYLDRICGFFNCSKQCFVVGLVYIDRVLKTRPDFVLNDLSAHRFLLASFVVAVKFHDDVHHSNAYFANVGGISLKSLNILEKDFLQLIGWHVCISANEYDQYFKLLERVTIDDI